MKLLNVFEDMHIKGDWDAKPRKDGFDNTVWTYKDKQVVQDTALKAKMIRLFPRFHKDLNIVFLSLPFDVRDEYTKPEHFIYSTVGRVMRDEGMEDVADEIQSVMNPDAINIILTNNTASQWIPLSPWMVMHRCVHAVMMPQAVTLTSFYAPLIHIIQGINVGYWGTEHKMEKQQLFQAMFDMLLHVQPFVDITSFKNNNISREGEIIMEMFVHFLRYGRIKFLYPDAYRDRPLIRENLPEMKKLFEQSGQQFSRQCNKLWNESKGQLFIL
jgi:hypothetical protein